ncbi:MAG: nucleotidyltransferase family protein [Desulfobacterales bacterium]|jgi:hypothetical protein|nr:nucleotidyltransferase family protein [Desulfobacterales bacterium]
MKPTPIEDKLLLWAAGYAAGPAPAWVPAAAGPAVSQRLVARALAEGMAGLLWRALNRTGRTEILPGPARNRLRSAYYLTLQTNTRHMAALRGLFAAFNSDGIRAAVIQGLSLLVDLYPDPGLRPVSDIDLWVLPDELDRAEAALRCLGFEATPRYPRLLRKGDLLIDLRTQIMGGERIRARRRLLKIDQRRIFANGRRLMYEGCELRCLCPADQAAFLTLHAIKHNWERLVWLADLSRLTGRWRAAEWDAFRRRALELGQPRLPAVVVYLLGLLPGGPPAAAGAADLRLSSLERHLLRRRTRGALPKWSSLALLRAGSGLRQAELALESMFPRPAVLRQVFAGRGERRDWQLYALRARQLLGLLRPPGPKSSADPHPT